MKWLLRYEIFLSYHFMNVNHKYQVALIFVELMLCGISVDKTAKMK